MKNDDLYVKDRKLLLWNSELSVWMSWISHSSVYLIGHNFCKEKFIMPDFSQCVKFVLKNYGNTAYKIVREY